MNDAATVTEISKAKTRRKPPVDDVVQLALTEHHDPKDLVPNPDNIRHDLGDLAELTESIRQHGVIQPLVASRDSSGQLVLIAGHRRRAAAAAAGLTSVPVVVRAEPDRAELFELMLAENNHRNDLDPIDEALAVAAIKAAGRKTIKDIAAAVNRSSTWVSTRLALAKLPEPVHELVRNGNLGVDDATAIATAKLPAGEIERIATLEGHELRAQVRDSAAKAKLESWTAKAKRAWPGRKIVKGEQHTIASKATFHAVAYGTRPGEISIPPEMGDADHQVININEWNGGKVTVFNVRPELLDAADFVPLARREESDDAVGLEIFHDDNFTPTIIRRLPGVPQYTWEATRTHKACPGHRRLSAPWSESLVPVCVTPWVHEPDRGPTWDELARTAAEQAKAEHAPPARPRRDWRDTLGPELTREMVATVMTAVSTIDPTLLVALSYCVLDDVDPDNYPEAIANEIGEQFDVVCRSVEETGTNLNASDLRMITWLRTIAQRVDAPLPVALLELEPEGAAE